MGFGLLTSLLGAWLAVFLAIESHVGPSLGLATAIVMEGERVSNAFPFVTIQGEAALWFDTAAYPGVKRALVIVGSGKRGTINGIYQLWPSTIWERLSAARGKVYRRPTDVSTTIAALFRFQLQRSSLIEFTPDLRGFVEEYERV